ncbi:PKD1L2 [Mytilus edulis]|uniref:PKD1L2 n=1 Tax=Mytilus edulis TaxID=6550 RepID=A0A8S3S2I7_MYTED|nr:PKD1L2 [Mytilus edulis]
MTYTTFEWKESPNISASAVIIDEVNTTLSVMSDNINKIGSFNVTTDDLSTKVFGVYHILLIITNINGDHLENLVLKYEETISNISIDVPAEVLIDMPMELIAMFSSGSNVHFDWIMNDNHTAYVICEDIVRECSVSYSYSVIGNFNITLVATNGASYEAKTDLLTSVLNPVTGFNFSVFEKLVNSTNDAEFILTTDSVERFPMGDFTLRIDFGDESSDNLYLNDTINDTLLTSGYRIFHTYLKQGQFMVNLNISSQLSSQYFQNITVLVSDDITQLSIDVPQFANTSTDIEFKFQNYPPNGFVFSILYGDRNERISKPGALFTHFDSTPWTYSYSSPGMYEIELTASNLATRIFCKRNITIQYPITELAISPSALSQYPIPDGNVELEITLISKEEPPTDVTCYFYPDLMMPNITFENVDIQYTRPFRIPHIYTGEGKKDITVRCVNNVSEVIVQTQLEMKIVTLNDFSFAYPRIAYNNMSLGNDKKVKSFSSQIEFTISVFKCVRFPPNVTFSFDFGDGSNKSNIVDSVVEHSYTKRRSFAVVVYIYNLTSGEKLKVDLPMMVGVIDFTTNINIGAVGLTTFVFNISRRTSNGSFKLFTDDSQSFNFLNFNNPILHSHTYMEYGEFIPYVIASVDDNTEIIYLDSPIYADYNLTVIVIDFNTSIELPPGIITINVTKHPLSVNLPNVECVFEFDDKIDRQQRKKIQNITDTNPLIYHFTYITLGYPTVNVTCYNKYDRTEKISKIVVQNECFPMTGMFDRQYSNIDNPLKLSTSEDVDLSNRMPVKCSDKEVKYEWEIYEVVNGSEHAFDYNPPVQPLGSIRFTKGSIPEGLYKVVLNVSIPATYLFEPTYLLFIKPPPFAIIYGGSLRQALLEKTTVSLDALTHSYDMEKGYGGNDNLTFDWSCSKRITDWRNLVGCLYYYEKYFSTFTDCGELLNATIENGKAELALLNISDYCYDITVKVSVDNLTSSYTQLLHSVPGIPPIITITCELNCMAKYTVSLKSIWHVSCTDCSLYEEITYRWYLQYKDDGGRWQTFKVNDIPRFSDTGMNAKSHAINSDTFEVKREYILYVRVSSSQFTSDGLAAMTFVTNQAPYGGKCMADPVIGYAATTAFKISCNGWKDEGISRGRNDTRDTEAQNFLKFAFITSEKDGTDVKNTTFQIGGEMTTNEIYLPMGDPENNYTLRLLVYIYDVYDDYNVSEITITSRPPITSNDSYAFNELFDKYDNTFAMVDKSGNNIALMRLMESTASTYKDLTLPTPTTPDMSTPMKCAYYVDSGEKQSDTKSFLQENYFEILEDMLSLMYNKVYILFDKSTETMVTIMDEKTPDENSEMGLNSEDAGFVAKAVKTIISNKALFTDKTSVVLLKILLSKAKEILAWLRAFGLFDDSKESVMRNIVKSWLSVKHNKEEKCDMCSNQE